jgi:hypothetical protein
VHLFCDGCRKKFALHAAARGQQQCPRRDGHRGTVLLRDARDVARFIQYKSKYILFCFWLCRRDSNAEVVKGELYVNWRFFIYDGCAIMCRATWNIPARAAA